MDHTATYSPDDNKLRLYPAYRLSAEEYGRVKTAGFSWAPRQELFVAPMWTPSRVDLLIDLAGEIGDEDTSLVDRAEERADRFGDYSDHRTQDAETAHKAVSAIADNIPLGQPILVGHHSERHARKDAERIQNGMAKAIKMWETAEYWKSRAAGAISHAKYLERPDVRARRIKKIEADRRKVERTKAAAEKRLKLWSPEWLENPDNLKRKDGAPTTILERAVFIANQLDHFSKCFTLAEYPREEPASQYEGPMSLWDALGGSDGPEFAIITPQQAAELATNSARRAISHCDRWIAHYDFRLTYERAMLAEQGGTAADRTGPEKGGACKCWAGPRGGWCYIQKVNKISVTVLDNWGNGGKNFTRTIPFDKLAGIMTATQVQHERDAGTLRETEDKTGFFLIGDFQGKPALTQTTTTPLDAFRDSLKAGVQVVTAPQLFPTPPELARRLVELADIQPGHRVLEPSAGTGALLKECFYLNGAGFTGNPPAGQTVAIEINRPIADTLRVMFPQMLIVNADFLTLNGDLGTFDRIIMNPPFSNAQDVAHINHARTFLSPGGRLVAICANGPRQRFELMPEADEWIDLPAGTFSESGTNVNVAMCVFTA